MSVQTLITHFSYLGILLLLLGAGIGIPISEDLVLLAAGVLASQGQLELSLAIVVGYVGVVLGDMLVYRIGHKLGPAVVQRRRFARLFSPRRVAWIQHHFSKRGMLTVVIARHLAGLRAPTFLMAGVSGMPFGRFVVADALSAMLTVPVVVVLGHQAGSRLPAILSHYKRVEHLILAVLGCLALLVGSYRLWRRRRREVVGQVDQAVELVKAGLSARADEPSKS